MLTKMLHLTENSFWTGWKGKLYQKKLAYWESYLSPKGADINKEKEGDKRFYHEPSKENKPLK